MSSEGPNDLTDAPQQEQQIHHWFWVNWALFEKMLFVLLIAIVLVCVAGFIKLRYRTHKERKHELKDEENAATIAAIERRAPMIEKRSGGEIPFGIRALESGIEIDGIWVSRTNTLIPRSLKEVRIDEPAPATSFESKSESGKTNQSERTSSGSLPNAVFSPSISRDSRSPIDLMLVSDAFLSPKSFKTPRESFRSSYSTNDGEPRPKPRHSQSRPRIDSNGYKPRRSSQLRFSSYGEPRCHEETLTRLEGKTETTLRARSHLKRAANAGTSGDSSSDAAAADNERSSTYSSDSEGTLSRKPAATSHKNMLPISMNGSPGLSLNDDRLPMVLSLLTPGFSSSCSSRLKFKPKVDEGPGSLTSPVGDFLLNHAANEFGTHIQHFTESSNSRDKRRVSYSHGDTSSTRPRRSLSGNLPLPKLTSSLDITDAFTTAEISPEKNSPSPAISDGFRTQDNHISSKEIRWPLLSSNIPESPRPPELPSQFGSRQVRANKSIRKVNSGFEILPAGTFGSPAVYVDRVVGGEMPSDSGGNRSSRKLQKRGPS